ncbi:unnamed protein product [Calypogeia fissa]
MDELSETFAWNERFLAEFYCSGEPETTEEEFPFFEVYRPVAIAESNSNAARSLRGMFLKDSAQPGELLIVSDAIASCECIREYTPYVEGSYVHAPKAAWRPPRPRVPREVHERLAHILRRYVDEGDGEDDLDEARLTAIRVTRVSKIRSYKFSKECQNSNFPSIARVLRLPQHDRSRSGIKGALGIFISILDLDSNDPNGGTNDSSSHGNPYSSRQDDEPGTSSSKERTKTGDLSRLLWNIVANNAMCTNVRSLSRDAPRQVETCDVWGVWLLPSFINHSCAPNCHRMIVGKTMFIRAAVPIAAGEELTLPYFDIFEPLTIRDAHCKTFGFRCECPRCTFERSLGQPYNDIQAQVVKLKIQLQTEWTVNGTSVSSSGEVTGTANMLLAQLAELFLPISVVVCKLHSTEMPLQNLFWIRASFIDVEIAVYALSTTASPFLCTVDPLVARCEWAKRETEEVRSQLRTIASAIVLGTVVWEVHPGNMLGQEFYALMVTAITRFSPHERDISKRLGEYMEEEFPFYKEQAMEFYSCYYGPHAYTSQLLGIES